MWFGTNQVSGEAVATKTRNSFERAKKKKRGKKENLLEKESAAAVGTPRQCDRDNNNYQILFDGGKNEFTCCGSHGVFTRRAIWQVLEMYRTYLNECVIIHNIVTTIPRDTYGNIIILYYVHCG